MRRRPCSARIAAFVRSINNFSIFHGCTSRESKVRICSRVSACVALRAKLRREQVECRRYDNE